MAHDRHAERPMAKNTEEGAQDDQCDHDPADSLKPPGPMLKGEILINRWALNALHGRGHRPSSFPVPSRIIDSVAAQAQVEWDQPSVVEWAQAGVDPAVERGSALEGWGAVEPSRSTRCSRAKRRMP